jgi:hypothetical protein
MYQVSDVAAYQQRFLALLDAEEEQLESDLCHYDMFEVFRGP